METTKNPVLPHHADHTYEDKFALVEFVTNSGIASFMNTMKLLGIDQGILDQALHSARALNQTVSLEFKGSVRTEFTPPVQRKVIASETVKETSILMPMGKTTETVQIKQSKWDYEFIYHIEFSLSIRKGNQDEAIILRNMSLVHPKLTTSNYEYSKNDLSRFKIERKYSEDLNLTWLLNMMTDDTNKCDFKVDRYHESCKTPIRNKDIKDALQFAIKLEHWSLDLKRAMSHTREILTLSSPEPSDVFVPIVPLFENSTVLSSEDLEAFLSFQVKSLDSTIESIRKQYKDDEGEMMVMEALVSHMQILSRRLQQSIAYVENMLEAQLIGAIGKIIKAEDFEEFMKLHNRAFFEDYFAPTPFSRAVRRPGHYPDGVISIEASNERNGSNGKPIETLVRNLSSTSDIAPTMFVPIDAATKVELQGSGQQFLHGWMQTLWRDQQRDMNHHLVARAHQFSSFLLIVGNLGGPDTFVPKEAIILQNKDEVLIPLLTEILPSAKEFKDAIASLSPKQKEFANAFRAMQLESSVLGICVIPLKPQMEKLLNLEEGTLTKEIQLMQDLMSLFVDYQIPSDLLSFDGAEHTLASEKVALVKDHVKAVLEVIEGEKKKQLERAQAKEKIMKAQGHKVYHHGQPLSAPSEVHVTELLLSDEMEHDNSIPVSTRNLRTNPHIQNDTKEPLKGNRQISLDLTSIPKILDVKLQEYDKDGALKSTIIKVGDEWDLRRKDSLLLPPQKSKLFGDDKDTEKKKGLDLLTAISRSGSLPIARSELHIIISVSHCFEKDVLSTVVKDNVNPIEKIEDSLLIFGSLIHDTSPLTLMVPEQRIKRELQMGKHELHEHAVDPVEAME